MEDAAGWDPEHDPEATSWGSKTNQETGPGPPGIGERMTRRETRRSAMHDRRLACLEELMEGLREAIGARGAE